MATIPIEVIVQDKTSPIGPTPVWDLEYCAQIEIVRGCCVKE